MNGMKVLGLCAVLLLTASLAMSGNALAKHDIMDTLSREHPIAVDKDSKTVAFLAEVNGKYFFNSTRHAAVFKGGKNGDKSVFRGLATPRAFYDGLLEIGAKPGDNMTLENKETTNVQGQLLSVTVTWEGAKKSYALDEVITDNNHKPIQPIRGKHVHVFVQGYRMPDLLGQLPCGHLQQRDLHVRCRRGKA